jgi:hypothetical protein
MWNVNGFEAKSESGTRLFAIHSQGAMVQIQYCPPLSKDKMSLNYMFRPICLYCSVPGTTYLRKKLYFLALYEGLE